jgi:hypothetical protein
MRSLLVVALLSLVVASTTPTTPTEMRGQTSTGDWSSVAAPPTAPRYASQHYATHLSNYVWWYDGNNPSNPFHRPSPGGVIEVSNCIIDSDGQFGTPSLPVTLTVKRGWQLWGGAWNQPIVEDAQGIGWMVKFVSINTEDQYQYNPWQTGDTKYFYTSWGGSYAANDIAPYSSHSPKLELLTEDAYRSFSLDKFPKGGRNTAVASPPPVEISDIPNETFEIAYCRVTETGETALSPAHRFIPPAFLPQYADTTPAQVVAVDYAIMDNHPMGTLGYYVYRRSKISEDEITKEITWSEWKRLPSPQLVGKPSKDANGNYDNPDDWLFPWWQRQISLRRSIDDAPVFAAAANPQSRLTKIHRLLRGDPVKDKDVLFAYLRGPDSITLKPGVAVPADGVVTAADVVVKPTYDPNYVEVDAAGQPVRIKRTFVGDVIVKPGEKFIVHCPVVDEWGNGDQGTTGGPGDQKFGRQIRSEHFGAWFIEQATSQSGHKSWPVVGITNSYSGWIACHIRAHGGDAATPSDYSGGQGFGNEFIRCKFEADTVAGRVTCGFRVDAACTAWAGGHTFSEAYFQKCGFNGSIPLWLAGNQTANLEFDRLWVNSYSLDSRGCVCYVSYNPSPINFSQMYTDAYLWSGLGFGRGVIFRVDAAPAELHVDRIWCDTGFTRFVEANSVSCKLNLTKGKLNYRGNKPLLGLFTGRPSGKSTWYVENTQTQPDGNTKGPYVINNNFRMFEFLYERTALGTTTLREPTEEVATQMLKRLSGDGAKLTIPEEPGYRTFIPGYEFSIPTVTMRERTQAEIDVLVLEYAKKIKNLPEWGRVFFKLFYLKYAIEPKVITVKLEARTLYTNSKTTGEKMLRETVPFIPVLKP